MRSSSARLPVTVPGPSLRSAITLNIAIRMPSGDGVSQKRLRGQIILYGGVCVFFFIVPYLQYATRLTASLLLPSRSQPQDKTAEHKVKSHKWAFLGSTFSLRYLYVRCVRYDAAR